MTNPASSSNGGSRTPMLRSCWQRSTSCSKRACQSPKTSAIGFSHIPTRPFVPRRLAGHLGDVAVDPLKPWIIDVPVKNVAEAARFYCRAFGATPASTDPSSALSRPSGCEDVHIGNVVLRVCDEATYVPSPAD